jgi:chaperonin GroEL
MLEDIAILTGGTVISEDLGMKLDKISMEHLGKAKKIVIDKENTTIVEGNGKDSDIKGRIKQIKKQMDETSSDYDREKLQERLAKLSGGVAIIKVGAATETELKEKKARVEDAMHATKAAVEEGIVCGGGVALMKTTREVEKIKLEGDQQYGINILLKSLLAPIKQLCANAGYEASAIIEKIRVNKDENYGFDVLNEKYVNMIEKGIIDPAKVVRIAIQNASSVAGILLTTEGLIFDLPEENTGGGMPAGMPGGMPGMGM